MNQHQQILAAAERNLFAHSELILYYEDVAIWVVCRACGVVWYVDKYIDPHSYEYYYKFTPAFIPPEDCANLK